MIQKEKALEKLTMMNRIIKERCKRSSILSLPSGDLYA